MAVPAELSATMVALGCREGPCESLPTTPARAAAIAGHSDGAREGTGSQSRERISSEGEHFSSDEGHFSSEGQRFSSDGDHFSSEGDHFSSEGDNFSSDGGRFSSERERFSSARNGARVTESVCGHLGGPCAGSEAAPRLSQLTCPECCFLSLRKVWFHVTEESKVGFRGRAGAAVVTHGSARAAAMNQPSREPIQLAPLSQTPGLLSNPSWAIPLPPAPEPPEGGKASSAAQWLPPGRCMDGGQRQGFSRRSTQRCTSGRSQRACLASSVPPLAHTPAAHSN